jgi:hypothetical protein
LANGFSLNAKLLVWEVEKLEDVTNTQPWAIDVCDLIGAYTRRAWAPEAVWDSAKGKYFLHFSIKADGVYDNGTFLYGIYTSDFKSFDGTPKRLINTGADNIDASINYNSSDDLYYMWYKNESNSKLNYATSPNIDGPYVNQASFDYSLGVEGPEIFKGLDGQWIFLCDAFGESADPGTSKQGVFQAFKSSTINGFDTNSPLSTNISYLYARHAGVTRITNAEYNALIAAYGDIADVAGGHKVSYYFSGNTSHTGTGWLGSVKDPAEQIFKVAHDDQTGSYSTSMGVLSLNNTSVFMQDDNVRTMLKSDAYTINFKCKITDSSLLSNSNMPIAAVGNINKDYIRLETDGEFYVNGTKVASGFTPAVNTQYDITISYNGAVASLFVDGEFKKSLVLDDSVVDPSGAQCYLALGWTDTCGETDRISADYKDLTIVNTAINTGNHDEDAIDTYIDNANTDDTIEDMEKVSQSEGSIYFGTSAVESGYYSNILYASRQTEYYNDTKVGYKSGTTNKRIQMRVSYPTVTAFYDGSSTIKIPAIMGLKVEASGGKNNVDPNMAYIGDDNFTVKSRWKGYSDGFTWSSNNTEYVGFKDTQAENQWDYYCGSTFDNNNTERSVKSYFTYTGTPSTTLTTQNGTTWYFGMNTNSERSNNSTSSAYTSYGGQNMVIRIIDVTSLNAIIDNLKGGNVTEYNNIKSDSNYYTPASTRDFLKAINQVAAVDINSYFSMSTTSADGTNNYSDAVTAIDNAVSAYNTAKSNLKRQYKVTYKRDVVGTENDGEIDHYYLETGTSSATVSDLAPSLTSVNAAHYHDSDYHYTYTWSGAGFANVSANVTYSTQQASSEAHTLVSQGHVEASGDTNGYTDYNCSVCNNHNLSDRAWDDRSADWTAYNAVADTISAKAADTQYTTDSRNAYAAACAEVTNNIDTSASKSKSYIDRQKDALTTAERKLNPVADYSALNTAVTDSDKIAAKGAYDSYTYSSWVPYATAYNAGNTLNNTAAATKANQPKFTTDSNGYITETLSDKQTEINTKTDAITTAYSALVAVPVEQYTVYETARRNIVDSLDSRKYNADGIATITGNTGAVTTADSELYKTLDGSEASVYSTLTGVEFAEGAQVRNCATAATVEADTESILTASTNLNASENKASYINRYAVNFSVQNDGGTTVYTNNTNPYYGESVDLTVPAEKLNGYKVALWSTTNFDDDGTTSTGSQKASGRVGSTYTKVVSGNMAVVAELEKTTDDMGENVKRYDICDAYGSVIDVIYSKTAKEDLTYSGATVTIGTDGSVTAKSIPFYSFNSWTCTDVSANHYKLAPQYEVTQTYDFDIVGASNVTAKSGTVTSTSRIENVVYDSLVTITSSDSNFAAWAVKTSANEYQIASYNSTCTFYACADEDYVAIVSADNGGYQTADAKPVAITGANIDGAVASGATLTPEQKTALVNDKITNKKPFIAIQNVKMTDKQARVYARITQGATGNTGYGVLYKSGSNPTEETFAGATKRNVTSALSTGQFTYTLNAKTTFSVNNVTFRTFVNYPAKYKYNNTDYEINGTDYSEIVVATKNA